MFNIKPPKKSYSYIQSLQHNAIKWQGVTARKDYWQAQTAPFRCREYFNDIVAKKHKRVYTVYGFNASPVRHKKDGVDVLVYHIENMDLFLENLKVVDDKMFEQLGCRMTFVLDLEEPSKCIINFPPACWNSSYTISVITIAIRASNYNYAYETWEDFFKTNAPIDLHEYSWNSYVRAKVSHYGMLPPEHLRSYWWYAGNTWNNLQVKGGANMIHNNGAVQWCNHLQLPEGVSNAL